MLKGGTFVRMAVRRMAQPQVRQFSLSACRKEMFTIQDENDFKDRVLKSDKPVVVNFKAT